MGGVVDFGGRTHPTSARWRHPHTPAATVACLILFAAAWVIATAAPVAAHAQLLSTSPANGQTLTQSPAVISLQFNEPVTASPGAIRVVDSTGVEMFSGGTARDATVTAPLDSALPDGTYIASWRVGSSDGHVIAGAFSFVVGDSHALPTEVSPVAALESPTALRATMYLTRAIAFAGALTVAGLVAWVVFVVPRRASRVTARTRRLIGPLALVSAVAAGLLLPLTAITNAGAGWLALGQWSMWIESAASDSGFAAAVAAACLAGLWALLGRPHGPNRLAPVAQGSAVAVAVALLATFTFVGHSRTRGPELLMVFADLVHVTAAAVWLGGIVGLTLLLTRKSEATHSVDSRLAAETISRFSSIAGATVVALAVGGVLMAWFVLGELSALFGSPYGVTLIVKLALTGVVLLIAGYNRFRLLARIQTTPRESAAWKLLRTTVRCEAIGLALITLVTAVLVSQNPTTAATSPVSGTPSSAPITVTQPFGSGQVHVTVTPATTGVNVIELSFTRAGAPVSLIELPTVTVELPEVGLGPLDRTVTLTGPGTYEAISDFPIAGEWGIVVSARPSRYENPVTRVTVEVQP